MPEVKIKIRAFPYYVDAEDPVTGRTVRREEVAVRGQTVDLSDSDYERAKRFGAIVTDEDAVATETSSAGPDADSAPELAEWIRTSKPTVEETVDAAEGDEERARLLLEAESLATGGQPRRGVVEGLERITSAE